MIKTNEHISHQSTVTIHIKGLGNKSQEESAAPQKKSTTLQRGSQFEHVGIHITHIQLETPSVLAKYVLLLQIEIPAGERIRVDVIIRTRHMSSTRDEVMLG